VVPTSVVSVIEVVDVLVGDTVVVGAVAEEECSTDMMEER